MKGRDGVKDSWMGGSLFQPALLKYMIHPSNNISIIQGAYVDVDHIDFTAPSAVYDINSWVNNITK